MKITPEQLSALFYGALACEAHAESFNKYNKPWGEQLKEYAKTLRAIADNVEVSDLIR